MKDFIKFLALLLFSALFVMGCQHKPTEVIDPTPTDTTGQGNNKQPCDSNIVYFGRDILPIFISNCAMSACHDDGTAANGIVLTSYQKVMQTGRVVAFDLNSSDLYEAITEVRPDKLMPPPPRQKLSATQISLIAKWINQGAKNLICEEQNCDTVNITYSTVVSKIMNNYCVGCHGSINPSAGISVNNYTSLAQIVSNGKLIGSITHAAGFKAMPQGGKLPTCEIKQIQKWVSLGFPNN